MSTTEQSPDTKKAASRANRFRDVTAGIAAGAVAATGAFVGANMVHARHDSEVIAGANKLITISEQDGFTVDTSAGSDPAKYGIDPYTVGQDQMGDDAVLSGNIVVHFDREKPSKSPDQAWLPLSLGKCSLGSVRVTFLGTEAHPTDITDYRFLVDGNEVHAQDAQQLVADNPEYSKC